MQSFIFAKLTLAAITYLLWNLDRIKENQILQVVKDSSLCASIKTVEFVWNTLAYMQISNEQGNKITQGMEIEKRKWFWIQYFIWI